jgi:uncharacterized protein YutE (UPF0331/DUF86 family)
MVDDELIAKQVAEIERALGILETHQTVTARDLERSVELRWTLERGLEVVMQSALHIAAHLLASEFKNDWDDYTSLIGKLGVHGVIPADFAEKFKAMAGFRNILVHEYVDIDLSVVERVMREELGSFRTFVRYVMEYLERTKPSKR